MIFLLNNKINLISQLTSSIVYFLQYFICFILLTIKYKKKKKFLLRSIIILVLTFLLCIFLSFLKASFCNYNLDFLNILIRLLNTFILLGFETFCLYFCFNENKLELLICELYFRSINTISGTSFSLLLNCLGIDDTKTISLFKEPLLTRDFTILAIHHLIIFIIFSYIYSRRQSIKSFSQTTFRVTILLFVSTIFESIIGSISRIFTTYSIGNAIIIKLYILIIAFLILFLIMMILHNNSVYTDLKITEELLYQEKKNYETSKKNIESINAMVHDFKHTINHIENKLNDEELDKIKNSIKLYELNIKTGNQILDSIIYEKQIICSNNKIQLTCMANGMLLSFITPYHLYSLFGNALDNAIEAVNKINDETKRIIGISITKDNLFVRIEIYNYFNFENYILTSKDNINNHGYGLKNIEYIVNVYHGNMKISKTEDIFSLLIILPYIKGNDIAKLK